MSLKCIALFFLLACSCLHAETFDGDYAGGYQLDPSSWSTFVFHFKSTDKSLTGTADMFQSFVMAQPLDTISVTDQHIHFEIHHNDLHLSFDGDLKNNTITGRVTSGAHSLPFHFDRTIKTNPSSFVGTYQLAPDHYLAINPAHINFQGVQVLVALDLRSGEVYPLFPRSDSTFFSTPVFNAGPAETTIEFSPDAQHHMTAKWTPKTGDPLIGHAVTLPTQNITFKNGDITLAGTLLLPFTPGPHPAVVFVHGSGPSSRNDYRSLATFFAANGVASLIFDKRGVGESTGDWASSGFDDFASDALAAVSLLKTRADIQPHSIGLCGMSQAGWIMPLLASRSPDVAFLISLSGAGVSPEEQGAFMVEHRIRAEHFSDADLQQALALYRLNSRCAKTNTGWEEFEASLTLARKAPWYHPEYTPQDHTSAPQWKLICDYEPLPALQNTHCPVLAILGGQDALVPPEKSAAIWKSALAHNPDATILLLPYADHGLNDPTMGGQHPEFFTLQRDWLLQHLKH